MKTQVMTINNSKAIGILMENREIKALGAIGMAALAYGTVCFAADAARKAVDAAAELKEARKSLEAAKAANNEEDIKGARGAWLGKAVDTTITAAETYALGKRAFVLAKGAVRLGIEAVKNI